MEQDRQRDAAGLFRAFALPNADTTLQAQCCGELHRRIADSAVQIEEARSDAARNAAGSTVRGVNSINRLMRSLRLTHQALIRADNVKPRPLDMLDTPWIRHDERKLKAKP